MPNNRSLVTRFGPSPLLDDEVATKRYVDTSGGANTFARVVQKATQTVNNSNTLVDVTEMVVSLSANKNYGFYLVIFGDMAAAADLQYAFTTLPAGASGDWSDAAAATPVGSGVADVTSALTGNGVSVGTVRMMLTQGRIIMAGTAGNLQLQFAQATADVSDCKFLQGSHLVVWEEIA